MRGSVCYITTAIAKQAAVLFKLRPDAGSVYAGAQKIKADAPYERMPVFVKAGSVIPFGPELLSN